MTTVVGMRDAIIVGLKSAIPQLLSVAKVDGNISNKDSIRRLSARAPAAFVSITGMSDIQKIGVATFNANCTVAVFLMTAGASRIEDYNNLVERIILAALENTWGIENTRYPTDISAEVIYNDDANYLQEKNKTLQMEGVLLSGIAWNQRTRITRVDRLDDLAEREARGETLAGTLPVDFPNIIFNPRTFSAVQSISIDQLAVGELV